LMLGCERWTVTHRSVADVLLALGLGLGLVVDVLLALGLGLGSVVDVLLSLALGLGLGLAAM
jgi:hypothetical protein